MKSLITVAATFLTLAPSALAAAGHVAPLKVG